VTGVQTCALPISHAQRIARDPARSADVGEALLQLARVQRSLGDAQAAVTAQRAAAALAAGLGVEHALVREAEAMARG
jgi:hypothetical protein